jgi:hypothetical protein
MNALACEQQLPTSVQNSAGVTMGRSTSGVAFTVLLCLGTALSFGVLQWEEPPPLVRFRLQAGILSNGRFGILHTVIG